MAKLTTGAPMFETARTQIREFTPLDAEAVYQFNGNAKVTQFTGDANMVSSMDDARRVIEQIWLREYQQYGYGRWAVVDKQTGNVIGFCGFKFIPAMGMPDIGYRFLPQYWGKGYATETALACAQFAKQTLGITQFFGDVMPQNIASLKVLEKLGLQFSGYVMEEGETFMRLTFASK